MQVPPGPRNCATAPGELPHAGAPRRTRQSLELKNRLPKGAGRDESRCKSQGRAQAREPDRFPRRPEPRATRVVKRRTALATARTGSCDRARVWPARSAMPEATPQARRLRGRGRNTARPRRDSSGTRARATIAATAEVPRSHPCQTERGRRLRARSIQYCRTFAPHKECADQRPRDASAASNFTVGVIHAADEKKASIAAAITSITAEPNTMTLVSCAAACSAVARRGAAGQQHGASQLETGGAAEDDRRELESRMRRDEREESSGEPAGGHVARDHPAEPTVEREDRARCRSRRSRRSRSTRSRCRRCA